MENFQETVDYINSKINPYSLSDQGKEMVANLLHRHSFNMICECIDISFEKYAYFDSNGNLSADSAGEILNKMVGIIRNRSRDPIEAEIAHVHGYGRKKFDEQWNTRRAQDILERYVSGLRRLNWSEEKIVED